MKKDYYSFEPNPDIEEIPTFTFANERNLRNYKGNIYNKEALIEQNSKNYVEYIKRFEKRKTPLSSPYLVFKQLTQNNLNTYSLDNNDDNDIKNNNNNFNNNNLNNNNLINNNLNNNNLNNNNKDKNKNFSNNYLHKSININGNKGEKVLNASISGNSIVYGDRKSEITNPELFYKRNNNDYFKYRAEQKKFLDYNYQVILNKDKDKYHKQEPNINPYNPKKEDFEHYKSDLIHNPILNPVNYYSYNKYLEKEIKEGNSRYGINNIGNYNMNNKRKLSPF